MKIFLLLHPRNPIVAIRKHIDQVHCIFESLALLYFALQTFEPLAAEGWRAVCQRFLGLSLPT